MQPIDYIVCDLCEEKTDYCLMEKMLNVRGEVNCVACGKRFDDKKINRHMKKLINLYYEGELDY